MPKLDAPFMDRRRQITQHEQTCGFNTGNPNQPRTALPGFDCRFDTLHNLFGFCPTTVIQATDCGLAGNCVDLFSCSTGCGIAGDPDVATFSCNLPGQQYCSTALLTDSVNAVFSYIACGGNPTPEHLLAYTLPQTQATLTKTTSPPSATATPTNTLANPTKTSSSVSNTVLTLNSSTTSSILPSITLVSQSSASISPTTQISNGTVATSLPRFNETGPIVGGLLGGLAIIVLFTLGSLFVRRHNKQPRTPGTPSRRPRSRWTLGSVTAMQAAGLHEKEGTIPSKSEMEILHELQGKVDGMDKHPAVWRGEPVFELST